MESAKIEALERKVAELEAKLQEKEKRDAKGKARRRGSEDDDDDEEEEDEVAKEKEMTRRKGKKKRTDKGVATPQRGQPLEREFLQARVGDNPLYSFYRKTCDHQSGEDRYALVCLLASENEIWPRKVHTSREVLQSSGGDGALLLEFFNDLLTKIAPSYGKWTTSGVVKREISFVDFVAILNAFYANIEKKTKKDGDHYLRKGTNKYRAKHLQGATRFANQDDKHYPAYYQAIAAGGYPFAGNQNRDPAVGIDVDHVLSCQVFSAMLRKSPGRYSFDRYSSAKTWLNKCWNFIAVPSTVNGHKSKIETKIIALIHGKCTVRAGKVVWRDLSPDEDKVLRDYFGLVGDTIQAHAKKDFLDQTKGAKKFLLQFLASLGAVVQVEKMEKDYRCATGCFCLQDNQSRKERLQTYHLFCDIKLPGVLANFTTLTDDIINKAKELEKAQAALKLKKNERQVNHYDQKRDGLL